MVKGLETTARELASSVVERGEVDCFKERDGQADASALTLAATSSDATRVCDATALKVPADASTKTNKLYVVPSQTGCDPPPSKM